MTPREQELVAENDLLRAQLILARAHIDIATDTINWARPFILNRRAMAAEMCDDWIRNHPIGKPAPTPQHSRD
jgi:hypothetical protein